MMSDIANDLVFITTSTTNIDTRSFDDIVEYVNMQYNKIHESTNPNFIRLTYIQQRRHEVFKPFLEDVGKQIAGIKNELSEKKNRNETFSIKNFDEFQNRFGLEPIDTAIFNKNYRSIPMLAMAVLIDYIMFPILLISLLIKKMYNHV
jgi:iron-sulfur cluster repair protein YtfE (RIC family)